MSRAQIDKLGDRLKVGPTTAADLRLLDEYRQTFRAAYVDVVAAVAALGFEPTGRPAKSTSAIIDKLRREPIRLTQIQDIAGCRIVVMDRTEQDDVAARLRERLADVEIVDRRVSPSHGYRAVHAVARRQGLPVEVQFAPSGSITGRRRRSDWRTRLGLGSSTDRGRPICNGRCPIGPKRSRDGRSGLRRGRPRAKLLWSSRRRQNASIRACWRRDAGRSRALQPFGVARPERDA